MFTKDWHVVTLNIPKLNKKCEKNTIKLTHNSVRKGKSNKVRNEDRYSSVRSGIILLSSEAVVMNVTKKIFIPYCQYFHNSSSLLLS